MKRATRKPVRGKMDLVSDVIRAINAEVDSRIEYCTCNRNRNSGWTHAGNQLWVHDECGRPSYMVWLKREYWDELDTIIERLMTGEDAADGLDKGRAENACYFLAILEHSDIVSIRNKAIRRFKVTQIAETIQRRTSPTRSDSVEVPTTSQVAEEV